MKDEGDVVEEGEENGVLFTMEEVTFEAILEEMDPEVHDQIRRSIASQQGTHVILAENHDMCSSAFGDRSVMVVGPTCTYKTVAECEGRWLNDLPSRRQYFTKWARVGDRPKEYVAVVGNLGQVYTGDESEARAAFDEYREQSRIEYGRAAGERVVLFVDGEIEDEYIPEQNDQKT